jgi:membrane-bound lytic murein transglycosylase A
MHIAALVLPVLSLAAQPRGLPRDWNTYWQEVPASQLPSNAPDGDLAAFRSALDRQIVNCQEFESGHYNHCPNETVPAGLECDFPVLQKLRDLAATSLDWPTFYSRARATFTWYKLKPQPDPGVKFTGYNAPLFEGTLKPDSTHRYPLYAKPADLVNTAAPGQQPVWQKKLSDGTFGPFDDRKMIDVDHSLAHQGLEIAWMEFPSDILRFQIEGSGVLEVRTARGTQQFGVNFAGKNGRPYVSVFKYLRDKNVDAKYLSFPGLKQYFADFPGDMWPTLVTDPSYTFFSLSSEPPCGAAKVYLTGGHSLAVDPSRLPLGMAAFFSAARPAPNGGADIPFTRFALAQDLGGAIQGAHVDVYWGTGDYAQLASDAMNSQGSLYIMKLK